MQCRHINAGFAACGPGPCRSDTDTAADVNHLDVSSIAKRQREIILLEQTDVLTDGIEQFLTAGRLLRRQTITTQLANLAQLQLAVSSEDRSVVK